MPKIKTPKKVTMKDCDKLWAECVKKKAGYKSELSGKEGKQIGGDSILNAHHLVGKANRRLRYELDNGLCVTSGEHFYTCHNQGRIESYRKKVMELRGEDIFDRLNLLGNGCSKTNLNLIKIYLENQLKEIK